MSRPLLRSLPLSLLLSVLVLATQAPAEPATFSVGSQSTWVNVYTRAAVRNGPRIGSVRVDLSQIEATCRATDRSFEGFVVLIPRSPSGVGSVSIECLSRPRDAAAPSAEAPEDPRRVDL